MTTTTDTTNAKKSKYRAVKTEIDGIVFDSKLEAAYWTKCKMLKQAVTYHPKIKFKIGRGEHYEPDFDNNWECCYIEVKGGSITKKGKKSSNATPMFRSKMRALREMHPGLRLKIIYGRAKNGMFETAWEEWLNTEKGAAK